MTDPGVIDTLQELQALIEADGGAFEMVRFDPSDGILRLRLVLDHVTCEECILPPEMLREHHGRMYSAHTIAEIRN